jgi:hypothetical protein
MDLPIREEILRRCRTIVVPGGRPIYGIVAEA